MTKKIKPSKAAKELAEDFDAAGLRATIYVDGYGDPFFASAWSKDIIVSNVMIPETKSKK